ncbi:MAG TPA: hypothetical protein VIF15_04410 [Polyangiaceae bacterium]|jgi:hypothetical protein
MYIAAEEAARKRFDEEDKRWNAPKFFATGFVTLFIAITIIYLMAAQQGCSLQIVP